MDGTDLSAETIQELYHKCIMDLTKKEKKGGDGIGYTI